MVRIACGALSVVILGLGMNAHAAVYNDAVGENFDGNGHMDITSVEVTNTLTDITFTIGLNGDIVATNWGKYLVGINTSDATGDVADPVGNPWSRNIRMADGMDAFIGSWVDSGGGFETHVFGAGWTNSGGGGAVTINPQSVSITATLASLGLAPGQTIEFDVYSSGGNGGDSANDAAANASQSIGDWGGPYTTPAGGGLSYTLVPEPASLALVALGGVGMLRRRR